MYNHPHQFINSYPVNYRAINDCLYVASGDGSFSSTLTFGSTGGRNLFTNYVPLGENIVTVDMPRPNLTMRAQSEIDIITTVNAANIMRIIIVDALEVMASTVTTQVKGSLQRGPDLDIVSDITMDIDDVIRRRITSVNIDTDVTVNVASGIIRAGSSEIIEHVSLVADAEVVKLSALTTADEIVTFAIWADIIRPHIYRAGSHIEIEEKVEVGGYVKQWATFIRPIVDVDIASSVIRNREIDIPTSVSMTASGNIKQWEVLINNSSQLQASGIIGIDGSSNITPSVRLTVNGSVITDVETGIIISNYVNMKAGQGLILFDSCSKLSIMEDKGHAWLTPEHEEEPKLLIRIDRSCFKNL